MTLHYRSLPDVTGVDLGPVHASSVLEPWKSGFPAYALIPLPALHPSDILPKLGSDYAVYGKRVLDVVLASIALILSAPLLVLLAAALWLESGNPFYTQERLGLNGQRFRMFKLRTMVPGAAQRLNEFLDRDPALRVEWELTQKLKRDPRITPIGRLLRKTSMDELPQIFNVLRGDMSLVGPRPMLPEQMPLYLNPPAYLGLRPGITGLWQVTARNEESFDLRAIIDLRYAQRLSFMGDLRIIGATFGSVLFATGY
ncbi:sugar transferase [Pararhodobacter zhoushanensis]|uniref:sugar transferase n=1 Tax=Pararhodobacter zhoushanensis TaxID=2479545 RepID=UPI000F8CABC8|nr:sugar transferase [Pararhodobacter zhoushanensis]